MIIAGIDPGMTGAIAVFAGGTLSDIHDMPCFDGRVDGLELSSILESVEMAYVENQHPMPKNGSISSFKLGMNYGVVLGILEQMAVPIVRVSVAQWRNGIGLRVRDKNASLALARELFPQFKPMLTRQRDHNRAEAALIGRYGVFRQIQERKANDEGDDAARPTGDRAVRGHGRQDHRAAGNAPLDQRPAQGSRRRGDRVAQVHALVRPVEDQDHHGSSA